MSIFHGAHTFPSSHKILGRSAADMLVKRQPKNKADKQEIAEQ
jgi:hypothetical protein